MSRGAEAHHVTGAMLSNCQSTDSPTGAETHLNINVGQGESLSDVITTFTSDVIIGSKIKV